MSLAAEAPPRVNIGDAYRRAATRFIEAAVKETGQLPTHPQVMEYLGGSRGCLGGKRLYTQRL